MKMRYGYAGIHLFERSTGLNILLDEIASPPEQWSRAPRYVSIALTNACELACSYCYAPKAPAKLTAESVVAWCAELSRHGCLGVGFGGGEPTLFPGFAALCSRIHMTTDLAVTMTTHGHRFDDRLVAELTGSVDFIRLSMDGIGVTYESHRGRPFDQFLEKLALVRSTARFGINYVVNETTLCDLSQAADFAFEQGAEELLLLPQVDANGDVALSGASRDWLSRWASDNWSRHRLATSTKGGEYIDAPMLMASEPEHEIFDFMHVDAFGMLKTSAFATTGTKLTNGRPIMPSVDELHVHRGVLQ